MPEFNLSKSQKRIARKVIEKGLSVDFERANEKTASLIAKWHDGKLDNEKAYHAIYWHVVKYDKHIARSYDGMSGSRYLFIIAAQLGDNCITRQDLEEFDPEVIEKINVLAGLD